MIELMFVVALMGIISAMAVLRISAAQPFLKANGAMRVILSQVKAARELAITQRRYMRVVFTNPNQVQIIREDVPNGTTVISTTVLEGRMQYLLVTGIPDTPDAFGKTAAVKFTAAVGLATDVKFSPDGTLVNQDGSTTNGSVFLAMPNVTESARAITVLGSTGRVRAYRWDGLSWKLV